MEDIKSLIKLARSPPRFWLQGVLSTPEVNECSDNMPGFAAAGSKKHILIAMKCCSRGTLHELGFGTCGFPVPWLLNLSKIYNWLVFVSHTLIEHAIWFELRYYETSRYSILSPHATSRNTSRKRHGSIQFSRPLAFNLKEFEA